MFRSQWVQRLAAAAAALALAGTAVPNMASADANLKSASSPKALHITVNITDTGFDQPDITVATNQAEFFGTVTFINTGTMVHSATELSSSPTRGFQVNNDPGGYFGKGHMFTNHFDTGGLGPGEARDMAFTYDGDYVFSSYPDCVAGDRPASTAFNCRSE